MTSFPVELGKDIDFAPASVVAEVLQNVRTILATRKGTVPLDRDFGLDWTWIDQPMPVAKMRCQVAVIEAINDYEPRAEIESVEWGGSESDAMEGITLPKVKINIKEEFLNE